MNDSNRKQTFPCTDMGNMERFLQHHQESIRFAGHKSSWLEWTGTHWKKVGSDRIFTLARETIVTIETEADEANSPGDKRKLQDWAEGSQSNARINAMIHMASKNEALVVNMNDFDSDESKINCRNGLIDLTNGQLKQRTSKDLVSNIINIDYTRDAKAPTFEAFVQQIFKNNAELVGWVQRALGYTLTGSRREQVLFMGIGSGANGKSTLLEVVARIIGDYSTTASFNTFVSGNVSDVRSLEAIGQLKGMRLALSSEPDSSRTFREDIIKQLTGDATLRGARLHSESFEFKPQFKLWLLANHLLSVKDFSHGYWRRIKVIPFERQFIGSEIDSGLPDKLWREREGILRWLVEGAVAYHEKLRLSDSSGLGPCKAIDEQVDQYRYDNDLANRFIDECLSESKGSRVFARDLYEAFADWSRQSGNNDIINEVTFSKRLEGAGFKKKRSNEGMVYKDVVVRNNNNLNNQ
ncbi:phage/plasmid primase, P4 family [Alphaproteobacteria bacterium]|nr:phage/plasmid primase, P4 family [Alphaproteobacteria bacterium]